MQIDRFKCRGNCQNEIAIFRGAQPLSSDVSFKGRRNSERQNGLYKKKLPMPAKVRKSEVHPLI